MWFYLMIGKSSGKENSIISIEVTLQLANHLCNLIDQFVDHDLQSTALAIARVQSCRI